MPGGNAATVTLQIPSSPFARTVEVVLRNGCISPLLTRTFSALGAYRRNVTLPSAWTSGETTGRRLVAWPGSGDELIALSITTVMPIAILLACRMSYLLVCEIGRASC